jgi:hypothetical protein
MSHWQALMEDRGMAPVITDELTGEDIYIGDLLVGLDSLPPRQREAFVKICMLGYTETAARDEMLPQSKSSTPVQQYADSGLVRMVAAYDLKQVGAWPPPVPEPKTELAKPRKKKTIRRKIMAALHPLLRKHLEDARKDILAQMEGLKVALAQVDDMLDSGAKEPAPTAPAAADQPAPNPKPEGKPNLQEMAKSLANTG